MANLFLYTTIITLLTGSSALYAAEKSHCTQENLQTIQNNRTILGVPYIRGPVKSLRAQSAPDPDDFREFTITTEIDFDPCGLITHFKSLRSDIAGRIKKTRILSASETGNNANYTFKNYRHRTGRTDRYPMVISTEFTKDEKQQIVGGKAKMYVENNDTTMHGDIQVQLQNGQLSGLITHWPDLYLDQNFKIGYDDAGRIISIATDGDSPLTQTFTYTPEGYSATQEDLYEGGVLTNRYFTECQRWDTHGNCTQERVSLQYIHGDKKTGLRENTATIVTKVIEYYP
ncbi:hypothetical protein [Morganella psychrotolerans]|uniref:hypothetical protein n=1 Tax=Morganella psychrotolerans TaxID=368603 RepID=UPI0039AF7226